MLCFVCRMGTWYDGHRAHSHIALNVLHASHFPSPKNMKLVSKKFSNIAVSYLDLYMTPNRKFIVMRVINGPILKFIFYTPTILSSHCQFLFALAELTPSSTVITLNLRLGVHVHYTLHTVHLPYTVICSVSISAPSASVSEQNFHPFVYSLQNCLLILISIFRGFLFCCGAVI